MAKAPTTFESAFNTYSVSEVIGEGGSGRVFAVKDDDGDIFALKCLFPDRVNTEKRKRFKNEISFCSKHQHQNIIRVTDSGLAIWNSKKCPFYVMPFYPLTLRKLIDKGLPPDGVLPLFSGILDGVEAAHLLGSTHRDLKPENILCDEKNVPVVAGFGIARFQTDILATTVETKPTAKMANLCYSAPEQRLRGAAVDRCADIFALGLILNEMFTHSVPQGVGYTTIARVTSQFTYLDEIVAKMIQQTPEARFGTIEEIKKELIGRRNEFVSLQELDSKRREVVPASTPPLFEPIKLMAIDDWNNGTLLLQLNRAPEDGWVRRFQSPHGGYNSISGAQTTDFGFQGDKAYIRAEESRAQVFIDYFKRYLEMANRGYEQDLKSRAQQQEIEKREKLQQEIAAAETRARVLEKLKI